MHFFGIRPSLMLKRLTLTNRNNMQVELVDFGARLNSIKVLTPSGRYIEVLHADKSDGDIINDKAFKGATCGRVANRISRACYPHSGALVKLEANEGVNILHGGAKGFSQRKWTLLFHRKHFDYDQAVFTLDSPEGECGFPGNLQAQVTYSLFNDDRLNIEFYAKSDALCPVNMCNHAYFTLGEPSVHNLQLFVDASSYAETNKEGIPSGRLINNTPDTDWQKSTRIGDKLALRDFDDCYVLNHKHPFCASLRSLNNGIELQIASDQAALQVYTGKHLTHTHAGVALEAQGLIDAPNHPNFEALWAGPEQEYERFVSYRFKRLG